MQADGSHIAESHQPSYYMPVVSSACPEVAADVNTVEPIMYHDISVGAVPHAAVVTVTGSSGLYVESGPVSYNDSVPVLDHASSLGYPVVSAKSSVPPEKQDSDVSAVAKESDKGSTQAASNVSAMQVANNALVNGIATVAPSAAVKSKSKVLHSKKRTVAVVPTLGSNKKVSRLVDKTTYLISGRLQKRNCMGKRMKNLKTPLKF